MNGKILQSNSEKHLGNIIGVGCNQKIIDDAVSDFYVRVNMVMSHFSHVASHVRYKLFKTYCMSLYGCQLWEYQSKVTNIFYVAWRKSVRRILGVPYTTHCNLLHYIAEDKDLKVQLYSRFIKFIQTLYNSNNKLSNICVTLALAGSTSHVSNNISTVCSFLNIPRYDVCSAWAWPGVGHCAGEDWRAGRLIDGLEPITPDFNVATSATIECPNCFCYFCHCIDHIDRFILIYEHFFLLGKHIWAIIPSRWMMVCATRFTTVFSICDQTWGEGLSGSSTSARVMEWIGTTRWTERGDQWQGLSGNNQRMRIWVSKEEGQWRWLTVAYAT